MGPEQDPAQTLEQPRFVAFFDENNQLAKLSGFPHEEEPVKGSEIDSASVNERLVAAEARQPLIDRPTEQPVVQSHQEESRRGIGSRILDKLLPESVINDRPLLGKATLVGGGLLALVGGAVASGVSIDKLDGGSTPVIESGQDLAKSIFETEDAQAQTTEEEPPTELSEEELKQLCVDAGTVPADAEANMTHRGKKNQTITVKENYSGMPLPCKDRYDRESTTIIKIQKGSQKVKHHVIKWYKAAVHRYGGQDADPEIFHADTIGAPSNSPGRYRCLPGKKKRGIIMELVNIVRDLRTGTFITGKIVGSSRVRRPVRISGGKC